jgi:hypothetical protein
MEAEQRIRWLGVVDQRVRMFARMDRREVELLPW